jgi:Amt family ammonium transporter
MGAIVIGLVAGIVCFWAVTSLKSIFKYDDSLDVFGVHGIGGIVGAILTGIFVDPALGGAGVTNYLATEATAVVGYDRAAQITSQLWGVGVSVVWTAVVSIVALLLIKVTIGLRVSEPAEREGLDITSHGERAYN